MKIKIMILIFICFWSNLKSQDTLYSGISYEFWYYSYENVDAPPLIIDLDNQCEDSIKVTIDLFTDYIPDLFYITDLDGFTIISTPWFGSMCYIYPALGEYGFVDVTPATVFILENYPPDFEFVADYLLGCGRITFTTTEKYLIFYHVPNRNFDTFFKFYLHEPEIISFAEPVSVFLGEYVCDSSLVDTTLAIESSICDTTFYYGYFLDVPIDIYYDTIIQQNTYLQYQFPEESLYEYITNDTIFQSVAYTEAGCPYTIYLNIIVYDNSAVFIPNIFTPNNDGINDSFYPHINNSYNYINIKIFNRWGALLHDSSEPWTAPHQDNPAVFVYLITINFGNGYHIYKGSITLVK